MRRTGTERCMSTSSPVRTRQRNRSARLPDAGSNRFPRRESVATVVRLILLAVAAVSVVGTSNYFAYMIGRKQATYEELRRQVDRVVQLMDQKQVEEEPAPVALKQRQDRLEQNAPGLTGLTTSTINGKTTVAVPEPAPAERPALAMVKDAAPVAPDHQVRLQTPGPSTNATTKHPDVRAVVRRQKAPKRPTAAVAQQPEQSTAAIPATHDVGAAGQ